MRLKRLLMRQFMSHPKTDINFDVTRGLLYIYGRNLDHVETDYTNCSGKSTILYAIQWALFGQISHPDYGSKNEVITHNADGCHVELDLVGTEGLLQIVRSKSAKGSEKLSARLGGVSVPEPVQANLEKFYGISWAVFCNTYFLGPSSRTTKFVTATPAERAKILGELINDSVFQNAAVKAQGELAVLDRERDRCLEACRNLEDNLKTLRESVQRIASSYNTEQAAQARKEAEVAGQVATLEVEILKRRDRLSNPPKQNTTTVQGMINTVYSEWESVKTKIAVLNSKVNQRPPQVGELCSTCGQAFSSHAHTDLAELRKQWVAERGVLEQQAVGLDGALRDLRAELQTVQQWAQVKAGIDREIDMLRAQVSVCRGSLENRTLVALHNEKEAAITNYKATEVLLREKQAQVADINLRLPVLKVIIQGFKSEIRNMLFDDVRKVLEYYASQYVQVLADHEFTLEFPPTTSTGREKFEIVIRRGGQENPLVSGGESYRAQLAILLALRKALSHQAKCPFEFILIDEVLSAVDEAGGRAVGNLISMLQADFPHILVTSPRPVEGEGEVILVERQNRMSRIVNG